MRAAPRAAAGAIAAGRGRWRRSGRRRGPRGGNVAARRRPSRAPDDRGRGALRDLRAPACGVPQSRTRTETRNFAVSVDVSAAPSRLEAQSPLGRGSAVEARKGTWGPRSARRRCPHTMGKPIATPTRPRHSHDGSTQAALASRLRADCDRARRTRRLPRSFAPRAVEPAISQRAPACPPTDPRRAIAPGVSYGTDPPTACARIRERRTPGRYIKYISNESQTRYAIKTPRTTEAPGA